MFLIVTLLYSNKYVYNILSLFRVHVQSHAFSSSLFFVIYFSTTGINTNVKTFQSTKFILVGVGGLLVVVAVVIIFVSCQSPRFVSQSRYCRNNILGTENILILRQMDFLKDQTLLLIWCSLAIFLSLSLLQSISYVHIQMHFLDKV